VERDSDYLVEGVMPMDYNAINCPHCGTRYEDETYGHVTIWGEDGPHECYCDSCDKAFWLTESVCRTYEASKETG
jgi:hypothetical protein